MILRHFCWKGCMFQYFIMDLLRKCIKFHDLSLQQRYIYLKYWMITPICPSEHKLSRRMRLLMNVRPFTLRTATRLMGRFTRRSKIMAKLARLLMLSLLLYSSLFRYSVSRIKGELLFPNIFPGEVECICNKQTSKFIILSWQKNYKLFVKMVFNFEYFFV